MEILQQMGSLPIFFLMFIIIYFLMIRPQSIQQNNHTKMLNALKKGYKVITRGGIVCKIVDIQGSNNEKIILNVGDNTKINILKSYIVSLSK